MNIFVLFILGYLLYRFIGGFLIPLFRTTSHMRQQFNNMNKQPGQDDHASNPTSQGFGASNGQRPTANGQRKPLKIPAPQKLENTLILRKSSKFKPMAEAWEYGGMGVWKGIAVNYCQRYQHANDHHQRISVIKIPGGK